MHARAGAADMPKELSLTWLFEQAGLDAAEISVLTVLVGDGQSGFENLAQDCLRDPIGFCALRLAEKLRAKELSTVRKECLQKVVETVRRGVPLRYSDAATLACHFMFCSMLGIFQLLDGTIHVCQALFLGTTQRKGHQHVHL
jgi:hypothetical protein